MIIGCRYFYHSETLYLGMTKEINLQPDFVLTIDLNFQSFKITIKTQITKPGR